MTGKKRKVWVWLTVQQLDAVLKLAEAVETRPGLVDVSLPERGERTAFRGAIAELQKTRTAMEAR